jgi:hypothetical protein
VASKATHAVVVLPPPPPAHNLFGDPAAFAAGIGRPSVSASVPVDDSDQDTTLDFPTITAWLTPIIDVQPTLVQYTDVLETNSLDRLNYVENPDLTIPALQGMSGRNFVQASAFLQMGKRACQE